MAARVGTVEHQLREVLRREPRLREQAPHRLERPHLVRREEVGRFALILLPGAGPHADLEDALGGDHVHHPGHRGGVVVPLAEELLAQVRVGVELEDAEVRDRGRQDLDDRERGGVVAAQHDRPQAGPPEPPDLLAGAGELLPGRAIAQLAVAQIGDGEVLQVAPEERGVGLDGVGGEPELAGAVVGAAPEVDAAFEGDAEEDDPGAREGGPAGDEAGLSRDQQPALDEIVVGEQGDRGQGAAGPLDPVLDREDLHVADRLAPDPKGLLEHLHDHPLGFLAGGLVVELHDDPVLGGVDRPSPADRGGHHLARNLARHGRVGGGHERARLDAGEPDQLDARRQDARDLDQVDVADAGGQEGVVEGVEWGRSFGGAGGAGGLRHRCEVHSVSPPSSLASSLAQC